MKQGTKMSISHFIFLFHSFLPVSLSRHFSLSLSLSGVGTAAGYMKTIHHCIFTIKLLTVGDEDLYWLRFYEVGQREKSPTCKNMKTSVKK